MQSLRNIYKDEGKEGIIYVDESGFEPHSYRPGGWSLKGKKVYGQTSGNKRPITSLIAGRCREKFLAPILFEGSTNSQWFNKWLEDCLLKKAPEKATIIMDNASFHKSQKTKKIIEKAGHKILFLPPYSPDLNPIEKDFAIIKKQRAYSNKSINTIIKMYRYYLE